MLRLPSNNSSTGTWDESLSVSVGSLFKSNGGGSSKRFWIANAAFLAGGCHDELSCRGCACCDEISLSPTTRKRAPPNKIEKLHHNISRNRRVKGTVRCATQHTQNSPPTACCGRAPRGKRPASATTATLATTVTERKGSFCWNHHQRYVDLSL